MGSGAHLGPARILSFVPLIHSQIDSLIDSQVLPLLRLGRGAGKADDETMLEMEPLEPSQPSYQQLVSKWQVELSRGLPTSSGYGPCFDTGIAHRCPHTLPSTGTRGLLLQGFIQEFGVGSKRAEIL